MILILQLLDVLGTLMGAPCSPKLDLDEVVQVNIKLFNEPVLRLKLRIL